MEEEKDKGDMTTHTLEGVLYLGNFSRIWVILQWNTYIFYHLMLQDFITSNSLVIT